MHAGVTSGVSGVDDPRDVGDRYPIGRGIEGHRRIGDLAVITDLRRPFGFIHAGHGDDRGKPGDLFQHRDDPRPDGFVADRTIADVHDDLIGVAGPLRCGRLEQILSFRGPGTRQAERIRVTGAERRRRHGERDEQHGPEPDEASRCRKHHLANADMTELPFCLERVKCARVERAGSAGRSRRRRGGRLAEHGADRGVDQDLVGAGGLRRGQAKDRGDEHRRGAGAGVVGVGPLE